MIKGFSKKILLVIFIVLMIMSTTVFAEPLKTETFYSKDPDDTEHFTYYDKTYGVLRLEVSNIISSDKNRITVHNSTDIKVVNEVNGARLEGYKMTKEDMEELLKLIAEFGTYYYSNPESKLGYSIDNNRIITLGDTSYTTFVSGTGTTITLTEEGYYFIYYGNGENQENEIIMLIEVVKEKDTATPSKSKDVELKAIPTSSKVLVNDEEISFEAYLIGGNNYLKLRDLATVVSGTEKEFEVTWDGNTKTVRIDTTAGYVSD